MNKQRVLTSVFMMAAMGVGAYPAQGQLGQDTTTLMVEISGLDGAQGQVCLNLFDSSAGFPSNRDEALQTQCVEAVAMEADVSGESVATAETAETAETTETVETAETPGEATEPLVVAFENLPLGSYAVSVFHDANGDGEFNRNFVGMPAEGFGFSRNPAALTGPPKFRDAVVLVAGEVTTIEIVLNYF